MATVPLVPATATIPLVPGTATTVAPGGAGQVQVVADCQTARYEPTSILVACADAGIVARSLQWSAWGNTSASATGVMVANDCTPNCAQGKAMSYPASFTLSGIVGSSSGPVFTTLGVHYDHGGPGGVSGQSFSLPVPGQG